MHDGALDGTLVGDDVGFEVRGARDGLAEGECVGLADVGIIVGFEVTGEPVDGDTDVGELVGGTGACVVVG